MVTGRKIGAYQKPLVSGIYNWLSRRIFKVPVSDLNSMKAFRREIVRGASPAARLASVLRGAGPRPGVFGDGDRHPASPPPGGGIQVLRAFSSRRRA